MEAGFIIPYSPNECVICSLAGCGGWEEYAMGDSRIEYHKREEGFRPEAGDIVLYDRVFINQEHDHIGIILEVKDNISRIINRPIDEHIRAYIRIPNSYRY